MHIRHSIGTQMARTKIRSEIFKYADNGGIWLPTHTGSKNFPKSNLFNQIATLYEDRVMMILTSGIPHFGTVTQKLALVMENFFCYRTYQEEEVVKEASICWDSYSLVIPPHRLQSRLQPARFLVTRGNVCTTLSVRSQFRWYGMWVIYWFRNVFICSFVVLTFQCETFSSRRFLVSEIPCRCCNGGGLVSTLYLLETQKKKREMNRGNEIATTLHKVTLVVIKGGKFSSYCVPSVPDHIIYHSSVIWLNSMLSCMPSSRWFKPNMKGHGTLSVNLCSQLLGYA